MFRFAAIVAFLIAVVLFVVCAIGTPNPSTLDWGFVATAAGLACLALEAVPWPRP